MSKLFHAVRPAVAVFGQKDFQQLAIVRRMTADLDFGIEIVGVPTVREPDGLGPVQPQPAPHPRQPGRGGVRAPGARCRRGLGGRRPQVGAWIVGAAEAVIEAEPVTKLEYCELRDPDTLELMDELDRPGLLAVAVWFGPVRLIDNVVLHPLPR